MLSVSMMKTKEGRRCSSEMTLTLAKNALQKVFGYSPNQLVLGYRLNLPSVIAPQLPTLEICYCNLLQKNLKAFCKLFYPDERLQLFLLKAFGLGLISSMRLGRMVGRTSICKIDLASFIQRLKPAFIRPPLQKEIIKDAK